MNTAIRILSLAAFCGIMAPAAALAQATPAGPDVNAAQGALARLPAKGGAKLSVSTPAFKDGGDIPFENTLYRANLFPGLTWSKGPPGTKAYVLVMQDTDFLRPAGEPLIHWTMINIPAAMTSLAPGLTEPPAGASFGPNFRGVNQPYRGPRTPAGPKHHYHFQIFAMDAPVPVEAAASYPTLAEAMKGHVLASGGVVGLGAVDPTAPPPAAVPPPAAPPPVAPKP